jgi:hypothetical protein
MPSESDPTTETTRIKVSLRIETKEALEKTARRHGVNLSRLIVSAAVERYLGPVGPVDPLIGGHDLSLVLQRLEDLQQKLAEFPDKNSAGSSAKPPKKPRWGSKRLGVTGHADHTPVIDMDGPPLQSPASWQRLMKVSLFTWIS